MSMVPFPVSFQFFWWFTTGWHQMTHVSNKCHHLFSITSSFSLSFISCKLHSIDKTQRIIKEYIFQFIPFRHHINLPMQFSNHVTRQFPGSRHNLGGIKDYDKCPWPSAENKKKSLHKNLSEGSWLSSPLWHGKVTCKHSLVSLGRPSHPPTPFSFVQSPTPLPCQLSIEASQPCQSLIYILTDLRALDLGSTLDHSTFSKKIILQDNDRPPKRFISLPRNQIRTNSSISDAKDTENIYHLDLTCTRRWFLLCVVIVKSPFQVLQNFLDLRRKFQRTDFFQQLT